MNSLRTIRWLLTGLLLVAASGSVAQVATQADEYQNRIKSSGAIQAFGGNSAFGEQVDLYTGSTTFEQTDLVLEGTGPAIRIVRRSIKGDLNAQGALMFSGFGDWELEIPQISVLVAGTTKTNSTVGLWQIRDAAGNPSNARCSGGSEIWWPPGGSYGAHTGGIPSVLWSQGMQLDIPGEGRQSVLLRSAAAPVPATGSYPWVTNRHWQIGCLPATTSGEPGEAFLVLAPDGTKYHLTWMTFDMYFSYRDEDDRWWSDMPRNLAHMKVTRIEDRFGNFVDYDYDGADRLVSITASDGRAVTIEWWSDAPLIRRISADGRSWNYSYHSRGADGGILSQVQLPDGSAWDFEGSATPHAYFPVDLGGGCFRPIQEQPPGITKTYTITAPSGLTGVFRFTDRLLAQSYMPSTCITSRGAAHETANPYLLAQALVQRQLSGPGLASATWNYVYAPAHASLERDCGDGSCPSTTYTDVTDPAGQRTRYIHSTRYGALQGKLLRTEFYEAEGTVPVRTEDRLYNYAESDKPYPGMLGTSADDPPFASENIIVLRKQVTVQQGRTFIWEVPAGCAGGLTGYCLDRFGRPLRVLKSSAE